MNFKLLYPNFKSKAVTFSFDDGSLHDIKLIEILNKYNLKATFNLNSNLSDTHKFRNDIDCSILDLSKFKDIYKGHEISTHTYNHPHLEDLNKEEIKEEYLKDINSLGKTFGLENIKGSAYPYGTYSLETLEVLNELNIKYSRTTRSISNFNLPFNFLLWNPTTHYLNERVNLLTQKFKTTNEELALYYLWGHSYELAVHNKFDKFESLCKELSNIQDAYFATNIEIYDYVNSANLVYYRNKKFVNPSKLDVYLEVNNEKILIKKESSFDYE